MKKIGLISLGCAKNLVDSELILGVFKKANYIISDQIEDSDAIIINTCGFINEAKKESIKTIFEVLQKKKKNSLLIVVGCLAKRYKQELLKEIPEIDLIIGVDEYHNLPTILENKFNNKFSSLSYENRVLTSFPLPFAYLKIGEGCSNRCAYCAIPLIRGDYYSYPKEVILKEAKRLIDIGIKELVIIAQDTTRYGKDIYKDYYLENLLEDILKLDSNCWVRLLYLYPDRISDNLIQLFSKYPNLLPYFDIPIQHSSQKMLNAMHRSGNKSIYLDVINKIKNKIPNAVFRTTLIVGFPGEDENDFNDLKEFVQEIKFDHLGVFTYSDEENTPSHKFKNKISKKIANQRKKEIMEIQQNISYLNNTKRINQIHDVIIEDFDGNNYYGRSYLYAPDTIDGFVIIKSKQPLTIGTIIKVKIIKAYAYDIEGEVLNR